MPVSTPILSLVPQTPDATVVDALEDLCAAAEKGELRGICYLTINRDGTYLIGTVGERMSAFEAAGGLHKLADELLRSV